ncbi:MAG: flagellar FlbD family protein [Treponema sp.]
MVKVTRLNGSQYWLNPHQIETIECNPDVTIHMLSGKNLIVRETPEALVEAIVAYRKRIGVFKNEI